MMSEIVNDHVCRPVIACFRDLEPNNTNGLVLISFGPRARDATGFAEGSSRTSVAFLLADGFEKFRLDPVAE